MSNSILLTKSYAFALRVVNLSRHLSEKKHEFTLSKKILDSGTNVGVLVEEARQGDDRSDFRQKLSVANKEAFKSNFWLRLLRDSKYITVKEAESMLSDCEEIQKMLISSIKKTRSQNI